MKRPQIHRLVRIHSIIKAAKFPSVRFLVDDLEVNRRTVLRDLEYLRDVCRAPLEYDRKKRGFHYLEQSFELPMLNLTEGEILTLALGLDLLANYRGTSLETVLRSTIEKLPLLLPEHISIRADALNQMISFGVEPLRGEEERVEKCFRLLSEANQGRRRVEMVYYTASRDTYTRRKMDPYHLRYMEGAWYLFAYCHHRQEVRIFALDRMDEVAILPESFTLPEDFTVEDFLRGSWRLERGGPPRTVVVRFDREAARYVRGKEWHPSQAMRELDDGSLFFQFTVSGMGEVSRWLLQFGSHAEVLEPAELRRIMAEEIERMGERYRKEPGELRPAEAVSLVDEDW
ncbi:MAG: WYL domain-containing protein [Firmicutes bacterium]|nr:WYL domain-containing protein [Bacillota bacterium]